MYVSEGFLYREGPLLGFHGKGCRNQESKRSLIMSSCVFMSLSVYRRIHSVPNPGSLGIGLSVLHQLPGSMRKTSAKSTGLTICVILRVVCSVACFVSYHGCVRCLLWPETPTPALRAHHRAEHALWAPCDAARNVHQGDSQTCEL